MQCFSLDEKRSFDCRQAGVQVIFLRVSIPGQIPIKKTAFFADELLRHTAVLFAGMMVVHVCNLVYQMAVSRVLPEQEYALLAAFLGVLSIVSYPLATLTTGLGHYSSLLQREGRAGDVKRLLRKWMLLTGIPGFLLGAAAVFFNAPVAAFLHLNRAAPVIIAGAVLPAMFWLPVLSGAAQGLQLFGWNSASGIAGALLKLLLGAGLVYLWYPACGWAMTGYSAGIYMSVAVLAAGLFAALRDSVKTDAVLPSMRFYLLQSFLVQIAFAILMNADVILVKHYLPANTEFAYAATLGRIVAFLPMAVAIAMFPKVASSGAMTAEHRKIFLRSFGFTGLCVAAAAVVCLLMPRLLLAILFGIRAAPDSMVFLTRLMSGAMAASALLNTVIQFLLAQRRFKATFAAVAACLLYLVSVRLFHSSAGQIAAASGVFNAGGLLACLYILLRRQPTAQL